MRLIQYTPDHFADLSRAVARMAGASSLCHRPFVDYYYATNDQCRLFLVVAREGEILGTLGVELMRFKHGSRELTLGLGSNYQSLQAGAGAYLYLKWLASCDGGVVFGGSTDTHRILRGEQWRYFDGIKTYHLNGSYLPQEGEPGWRVGAKWLLRHSLKAIRRRHTRRLSAKCAEKLSVREESDYCEDLLPCDSPFAFRFAPTVAYLKWRYNLRLPFVQYRLFRVLAADATIGYVVINESKERVIVSHCDGSDTILLAWGVLLSVLEVNGEKETARPVLLSSSNPKMQQIYESFGFTRRRQDRPFAVGALRQKPELPSGTSCWLVNYDWGDNGLRTPFRDQERPARGG
jgi:hypothetical protein